MGDGGSAKVWQQGGLMMMEERDEGNYAPNVTAISVGCGLWSLCLSLHYTSRPRS